MVGPKASRCGRRRLVPLVIALLLLIVAACATPLPTLTPTHTAALAPTCTVPPTPSPLPTTVHTGTPAVTATRVTTALPSPTPHPTLEWQYLSNTTDLRDIAVAQDTLWIAALSGLVRYRPSEDHWQVWTTASGLADNTCESVVVWEDAVWVGTQAGISRYDPASEQWRSFSGKHGLPGLHNTRLYVDPYANTLWVGTFEGLASYNPDTDRWIEQSLDGEPFESITSLAADAKALWIAGTHSTDTGVWQIEKQTGTEPDVHSAQGLPAGHYALAADETRAWALSSRGTLYEHGQQTQDWRPLAQWDDREMLFPAKISYQDPELWIGYSRGWIRYDVDAGLGERMPSSSYGPHAAAGPPVFAMHAAWFPTSAGLFALDLPSLAWSRHIPLRAPEAVTQILFAKQDRLFLNTGSQLGTWDPRHGKWSPIQMPKELSQGQPTAAQRFNTPDLWLYSPPIGVPAAHAAPRIWHYATQDAAPTPVDVPPGLSPTRLLPLIDRNALWFQANTALLVYDLESRQWHQAVIAQKDGYVSGVAQETALIWLIREGNTLLRFDTAQVNYRAIPIPYGSNWTYVAPAQGTVWLGGDTSTILAFDRESERWAQHRLDTACVGQRITALQANQSDVWAGGELGVVRYDQDTRQQTCYTRSHGMLSERVTQIALSGDWVWFVHPWRGLWGFGASRGARP